MRRFRLHSALLIVAASVAALAGCAATAPQTGIAVYDSRAVAIAWARSDGFRGELRAMADERARASAVGETSRVAELDARGAALQERIHRQGFGTAPVDDVLDRVAPQVGAVREHAGASRLVSKWSDDAPRARAPDVTDDLVRLFSPDAETLRVIREVRAKSPER